jgi:DinB superfamily
MQMNPITLRALSFFPDQLEAHYAAFPVGYEHWSPTSWEGIPSEPLTAIEQVCHVRDIEIEGYHVRFNRTLSEVNPVFVAIDTEGLARERSYATSDVSEAFAAFRAARAVAVDLIAGLSPEQLGRPAIFEGYGSVTLCSLVHYLCSHDQQHLAGLQWLLGKVASTASATVANER